LRVAPASIRERIDVWGAHHWISITAVVLPADVVRDEDNDVRRFGRSRFMFHGKNEPKAEKQKRKVSGCFHRVKKMEFGCGEIEHGAAVFIER
jgi:hypothetical protein